MAGTPQNLSFFEERAVESSTLHTTGLLPSQEITALVARGGIAAKVPVDPSQIQPASIDLRLGPVGYRVRASFLPGEHATVVSKLDDLSMHTLDLTHPCALERGCVYVVPVLEELSLPSEI